MRQLLFHLCSAYTGKMRNVSMQKEVYKEINLNQFSTVKKEKGVEKAQLAKAVLEIGCNSNPLIIENDCLSQEKRRVETRHKSLPN